jgi:P4 family phage/plasmid primase-like protien
LNFKEMGNFCNKYLHIFNVHEHEQVYAWDFNDLIYEKMSRESMSKKFNDLIQPTLIDPTQTKLKGYDTMAIEHSVKEITVLPPEGFVPLKNGWLNVLKGDLENYSPKYLVTQKIPVNYDPIAACPRFEKFLEERIGDKETIEVLLEYICYALCGIRYPNRKILVLEGPKGTGKTTIITMLQNLFGHLSTMSQLQHLTGRFETSMFENKRLVLFDEAPTGKDQNLIELLKNLSGSPYIKIERKNENAMTVQNLARLIIACNEIPRGGAIDSGFMDRLLIVPMHNAIETYNMIEANQMIEEELSGILNLILKRFSRLKLKNFNIDQTALTQEQANTYQKDNDPIAQFMSTELDFVQHIIQTNEDIQINSKRGTLETTISLSNFRKEFIRWAESENPYYRTMSSVTVRKHLEVLSKTVFKKKFTLKNTNLGWFLVGIRFKNRELLENPRRDNAEY